MVVWEVEGEVEGVVDDREGVVKIEWERDGVLMVVLAVVGLRKEEEAEKAVLGQSREWRRRREW